MHIIRYTLILAIASIWLITLGCSRTDTKSMQAFLDKISHAPESELPTLLYGYDQASPGARKVLIGDLFPVRAPLPEQHMSIDAIHQHGRFTMIAARVPWPRGSQPPGLQPIIIAGAAGQEQVVGYVLPFDDIMPLMQRADMDSIGELSQWWIERYGMRDGRKP